MAERIKEIRRKNGASYGEPYPLGADAKYVDLENNKTVQAVIGDYQKISPIAEIIEKHFYGSMDLWNSLTLEEKKDYDVVDILNEYTIHYENNGGSGSIPDGKKLQNDDYVIADGSSLTHSNTIGDEYIEDNGYRYKDIYSHSFDKWNTETDGSGINYNSDSIYSDDKNLTLYAQWTNVDTGVADPSYDQYYLTVNKDEGIESCTDSQWVDKGDSVNIEAIPKQYYEIVDGLGSSGAMNSAKTVNVKSILGLKFSSDSNFTLSVTNPGWDGILEYTTDNGDTWTTWDGSGLEGTATQPIYLRGIGNTVITGSSSNKWTFTGKYCTGNIETLLDYQTVIRGEHPTMGDYCYYRMFQGCTSLTTPPELPATTLAKGCYGSMFFNCTSLTTPPELPATTLADYCYSDMFSGCTSLKLSTTQVGEYQYEYRIPKSGTGIDATSALWDMFTNTGGTFTGTPDINTTYYTDHQPV